MNPVIKTNWVKAMLSGDYPQGRYRLRSKDNKWCCYGVLCDLAVKAGAATWEELSLDDADEFHWLCDGTGGVIPGSVAKWAGLLDEESRYNFVDIMIGERVGSAWNDEYGADFKVIAQLIEENL